MPELIPQTVWTLVAFNSAEDLVLLTKDGQLFVVDIIFSKVRGKAKFMNLSMDSKAKSKIADAKLES